MDKKELNRIFQKGLYYRVLREGGLRRSYASVHFKWTFT